MKQGNASRDVESRVIHWCAGETCCDPLWEQAYRDFETPEEEIRKFVRRHRIMGVDKWSLDSQIVEIFCGRGNGIVALKQLGFRQIEGVDLSADLLATYEGPEQLYVGDCRELHFPEDSKDLFVVQGGLHHLPSLPDDLDAVLSEVRRVLRPNGRFVVVEPWLTPFLRFVHTVYSVALLRRSWNKLDALARMNEREATTYHQWLDQSKEIVNSLTQHFEERFKRIAWGKLMFVGEKT